MHTLRTLTVMFGLLALPRLAGAEIHVYNFDLEGLQEVPPNASPGSGSATVTLDDVTGDVSVTGVFQDLVGSATASHIHGLAAPGVNTGVLIGLTVVGTTSGTISGGGTLSPANVQGMLDGLTYVNLHSSVFPGGELRGQVVPEPGALALLAVGALLLRRR